jgi:hypothetical protein
MSLTVKTGVLIGVLCAAWTYVMGFTGWFKDPTLQAAFFLVILIEVALLLWGLRQTADANTYGRQVMTGTTMAVIAAAIIFVNSLVFTMVVFPNYFQDLEQAYRQVLRTQGRSEADIAEAIARQASAQTPFVQAMQGAVGTVITGLVASLLIAIRYRRR